MRMILFSVCALSAMTGTLAAQTKPTAGSNEIHWVATLTVPPGNMDKFKQVVTELVAATQQESGILQYEYAANADNGTVDITERYVDSYAVIHHLAEPAVMAKDDKGVRVARRSESVETSSRA